VSSAPPARCGGCGAELAAGDEAIEVDGSHRHRRANSAGVIFEVACYRRAPGCAGSGPATDEDTWFAGHTWRRSYCRRCGAHAGWLFRSRSRVFSALMVDGSRSEVGEQR
jgi:hypothetical protein